jgi:hypothetical protein
MVREAESECAALFLLNRAVLYVLILMLSILFNVSFIASKGQHVSAMLIVQLLARGPQHSNCE